MKKAIKLLVLAGALLSVGAMAAKTTTFNFKFPQYLYVYTNLTSEDFDFTASSTGNHPGTYGNTAIATEANLKTCMENLSLPSSVTAQTSAGTSAISTGSCDFVATDTTKNSDFSVDWGSTGENPDGALLVLTNVSDWSAKATITSAFSNVDSYVTLKVRTDSNGTLSNLSSSATTVGSKSGTTLTNAYYTNYINAYVVPLQFVLTLDNPFAIPEGNDTAVVTYSVSSP